MELSGKIIAILPLQSGTGRNGNEWKKQEYVIETHDQYPKKMCFNLWGDKVDQFNIQMGEELTVSFDVDCREWQGRWFNDIRAWKVERVVAGVVPGQDFQTPPAMPPVEFTTGDVNDDLPF
ncbi:MAG: DUF3127 domain-containing protein [Bacteroides sp.]|nr:DUF3127 domain-containing protein [Bacteroides sp.]